MPRLLPCLLVTLAMAACGRAAAPAAIRIGGPTMGTTWSVTLVPGSRPLADAQVEEIRTAIAAYLDRIDDLMSTWDDRSELSRFNRSSGVEPFPVAHETFEVLEWAARLTRETGGSFDVTVGPLVDAWGFGAGGDVPAPSPETVRLLRAATGMAHLELDPDAQSIRKRHPGVRCDVSGLAAGYAADRIADLLRARGLDDVLVDVGGEIVARGRNVHGGPWRVAVELPAPADAAARVVELSDLAIATSGDYRNYRDVDGARVAHILDPRTGYPIGHRLASATVVDRLGVRADALATALMVLGPDEGLALADRLDLAVLLVVRQEDGTFETRTSSGFEALGRRD